MDQPTDTNAAIWRSEELVQDRAAKAPERERKNAAQWQLMAAILPFNEADAFTFLELGAGTGSAGREILARYPRSAAVLTDFSTQMMAVGEAEMEQLSGRFEFVEFDMSTDSWPAALLTRFDAVITSMCIHHMPDERKQGLFAEIFERLAPGGWYLNYDSVSTDDSMVAAAWQRATDRDNPPGAEGRLARTPQEQARWENHVRYLSPLPQQLDYLRSAGFDAIDVYWKHLGDVIYGGRRPPHPHRPIAVRTSLPAHDPTVDAASRG